MKPLATSHRWLVWLCMCPPPKSVTLIDKLAYALLTLIVFIGNAGTFASCGAFSWKYATIDLAASLYSVMNIAANFGVVYACCSITLFDRAKVKIILDKLTGIYRKCECVESVNCVLTVSIWYPNFRNQKFIFIIIFTLNFDFRRSKPRSIPIFNRGQREKWMDLVNVLQIHAVLVLKQFHYDNNLNFSVLDGI